MTRLMLEAAVPLAKQDEAWQSQPSHHKELAKVGVG